MAYVGYAAARPTLFRLGLVEMPSRRTSVGQEPARGSPYAILLGAVRAALTSGALTETEHLRRRGDRATRSGPPSTAWLCSNRPTSAGSTRTSPPPTGWPCESC